MHKIHITSSEMKKVTLKNFIRNFIFSRQHKLSALVDIACIFHKNVNLDFPYTLQFFFSSFVCIVEERTSPPVFSLSLTVHSKSHGFSWSKLEKLSSDRNSHWRCSVKKMFLEISQNPQENTCARVPFSVKLQASALQLY